MLQNIFGACLQVTNQAGRFVATHNFSSLVELLGIDYFVKCFHLYIICVGKLAQHSLHGQHNFVLVLVTCIFAHPPPWAFCIHYWVDFLLCACLCYLLRVWHHLRTFPIVVRMVSSSERRKIVCRSRILLVVCCHTQFFLSC